MRQGLLILVALVLLAFGNPARAEPACGSDTSPDPIEAMGKDVWLNGYCKAFLPCRLVLEQFHACQAAENFLSRLGAKQGQPLTEGQVEDALIQTTGKSSGVEACLWNFDGESCKRYLGIGGGIGGSEPEVPPPAAASASGAPPGRKPMSQEAAIVARQRVRDMDANAHTAVGVIERACRAGANECRSTLESMVDPVIRAADELNANPEYLAHFPPHSPSSIEYANRLGWTWQNGQWVFGGTQKAGGNTGTLGAYLLSVDECQKLHDRLDQEIKANPGREPDNLSFFEGECGPQVAGYTHAVGAWRALLAAGAKKEKPVPASGDPQTAAQGDGGALVGDAHDTALIVTPDEGLSQWNTEILAEEQRYRTEIEEKRRAAAIAEEERRKAESVANAKASAAQTAGRASAGGPGQYETICDRDDAKLQAQVTQSGLRFYSSGYGVYLRDKLTVERAQRCKASSRTQMNYYRDALDGIQKFERECGRRIAGHNECDLREEDQQFVDYLRREQSVMLSDDNYSASFGGVGGATRGTPQCEQARATQDEELRQLQNRPIVSGSVVNAMQRVMFVASERMQVIKTMCADNPGYMSEISSLEVAYKAAERGCRAVASDPDAACRPAPN